MGMFDMLGKINELKGKMSEVKSRLDTITVDGESPGGSVQITMTANLKVTRIHITPDLLHPDRKDEVEDMLEIAFNNSIEKAKNVSESEMKAAGKGLLPDIPGLF